ncbi:MAG: ABC transporter ATP-binding protein [Gammaproteobacteria bacterium]|nr:ABC transporter ATP-binding protein [Gammaproteobacteria bacterium]
MAKPSNNLLTVDGLSVRLGRAGARTEVVHDVSFTVAAGEKLVVVGESGSGKTVTALSILKLHETALVDYHRGAVNFAGRNLLALSEDELRRVRGREVAMIFQEPMTALNPVYPIGEQLIEPLMVHEGMERAAARRRMIDLLARTGISEPERRMESYPHMLSGGQRQRVMIAMALACSPKLLIADEPTTALDVTVQIQILQLLEELQKEFGMALLLITHDLNLVRRFADRVCVMQHGRVVEQGGVQQIFTQPQHAYTRHLMNSRPERLVDAGEAQALAARPLLAELEHIRCHFPIKSGFFRREIGRIRAVDDVSVAVHEGETVGIVGESGSGKTTLGLCLLRLQACQGEIRLDGKRLDSLSQRELRPLRRDLQIVFQDPYSSLSPRMTVEDIVGEGLRIHFPQFNAAERRVKIIKVLQEVGLDESMLWRYPHEFSGGQRQRIAIARVIVLEPKLVLLDEPTSALDVSVQKQVLQLLRELQRRHRLSYVFISHDLGVIRSMAHRVVVMRNGQVVESGETEVLFSQPQADYTRTLLQASLVN